MSALGLQELDGPRTSKQTRRRFLKASGIAIAAAGAPLALSSKADAQDGRVAQDIAVLNYALTLELLEANFYVTGLARFGAADFAAFGIPTLFDRLRDIRDHENTHVTTLTTIITDLGGAPVSGGVFTFPFTDARTFLRIAETLENTGVMAYDGAVKLIEAGALQQAGATIATVEARHAAFLNYVNGDNPFPAPFDTPKTPTEILAAAKPFIVTAPTPRR
jgi:rubrerythrin